MKTALLMLAFVAAAGFAGQWVAGFEPVLHPKPPALDLHAQEQQAGASLIGQFRTTATGWLWMRTDLYLHNGVEMRRLTDDEVRSGVEGAHNEDHDDDGLCQDGALQTVVPSAKHDFRGVFGDIERATSAYQDMSKHVHNDPKSALPLFRLMTWVDPQFTPAWVVGGSILMRDRNPAATAEAERYLRQGLYENPDSISIHVQLAQLLVTRKKDLKGAIRPLADAVALGLKNPKGLDEESLVAFNDAFRWLALCRRDLGDTEEEHRIVETGLRLFPDDGALQRLLKDDGMPAIPTIFSPAYQDKLRREGKFR